MIAHEDLMDIGMQLIGFGEGDMYLDLRELAAVPAEFMDASDPGRYVRISRASGSFRIRMARDFASGNISGPARTVLSQNLMKGDFAAFEDAVYEMGLDELWSAHVTRAAYDAAVEWLGKKGIEAPAPLDRRL